MKCPICKNREHIEIDLHADGFSQDARECGDCGSIWTFSGKVLKLIKGGDHTSKPRYSNFICPTCNSALCIKTDLNGFQFHEAIQECANCGTVCSSAHDLVEVIKDSQDNSFLSITSEQVESDDYIYR